MYVSVFGKGRQIPLLLCYSSFLQTVVNVAEDDNVRLRPQLRLVYLVNSSQPNVQESLRFGLPTLILSDSTWPPAACTWFEL
jgi:hypothetical protein